MKDTNNLKNREDMEFTKGFGRHSESVQKEGPKRNGGRGGH